MVTNLLECARQAPGCGAVSWQRGKWMVGSGNTNRSNGRSSSLPNRGITTIVKNADYFNAIRTIPIKDAVWKSLDWRTAQSFSRFRKQLRSRTNPVQHLAHSRHQVFAKSFSAFLIPLSRFVQIVLGLRRENN